jgi:Uma2 family endonuclease
MTTATRSNIARPAQSQVHTLAYYFMKEEQNAEKHIFHNGQIIKMSGGTIAHAVIANNTSFALKMELRRVPANYIVAGSDLKIHLQVVNKVVYADALVIFDKPIASPNSDHAIINPLVIVEVLSRSTSKHDKTSKFYDYQTVDTFREYVLIEQKSVYVEVWFKEFDGDEEIWRKRTEIDINKSIMLRSLGISIRLQDIYENIHF